MRERNEEEGGRNLGEKKQLRQVIDLQFDSDNLQYFWAIYREPKNIKRESTKVRKDRKYK